MADDAGLTLTQREVAALCNLSTRQVRNLEEQGLPFRSEQGRKVYGPDAVVWYWEQKLAEVEGERDETPIEAARRREVEARAALKEMEVGERSRELMPRDEALDRLEEALLLVDTTLRGQPRKLAADWARRLGVKEAQALEMVEAMIEDVRGSLLEAGEALGGDARAA